MQRVSRTSTSTMAQGRGAETPRLQEPAVRGGSGEGFEHEDEHEHESAGTRGRDAPPTGPALRAGSGEGFEHEDEGIRDCRLGGGDGRVPWFALSLFLLDFPGVFA